jgi:hypothetical protein
MGLNVEGLRRKGGKTVFITLQFYRGFNRDLKGVWPKKAAAKK